eukprot:scaffold590001_cov15-Prasinocladus_malaysianus.AAC.1
MMRARKHEINISSSRVIATTEQFNCRTTYDYYWLEKDRVQIYFTTYAGRATLLPSNILPACNLGRVAADAHYMGRPTMMDRRRNW